MGLEVLSPTSAEGNAVQWSAVALSSKSRHLLNCLCFESTLCGELFRFTFPEIIVLQLFLYQVTELSKTYESETKQIQDGGGNLKSGPDIWYSELSSVREIAELVAATGETVNLNDLQCESSPRFAPVSAFQLSHDKR